MSIEKPYQPSPEEIEKTEEMMTGEREVTFEAGQKSDAEEKLGIEYIRDRIESYMGKINAYGVFYFMLKDGKRMGYHKIVGLEDDNVIIDQLLSRDEIGSSYNYGFNRQGYVIYKSGPKVEEKDMPCRTIKIPLEKIKDIFSSGV